MAAREALHVVAALDDLNVQRRCFRDRRVGLMRVLSAVRPQELPGKAAALACERAPARNAKDRRPCRRGRRSEDGLAACQRGFSIALFTAASLVHQLMEASDERRLLNHIAANLKTPRESATRRRGITSIARSTKREKPLKSVPSGGAGNPRQTPARQTDSNTIVEIFEKSDRT